MCRIPKEPGPRLLKPGQLGSIEWRSSSARSGKLLVFMMPSGSRTIEITMDKELLIAALSFWCSATNTMALPLGPLGPTVVDIFDILLVSPSTLLSLGVRRTSTLTHCLMLGPSKQSTNPRRTKFRSYIRTSSTIIPLSSPLLVEGKRVSIKENMRPSCSTGTTSSSVVPNRTNAWSRTCLWPKPWPVVTPWHLVQPFFAHLLALPSRGKLLKRSTCTRTGLSRSFNYGYRLTLLHSGQTS